MARHHRSPHHLDDPLRLVLGLSAAQALGALLAAGAALGTWRLLGRSPHPSYQLTEARIFATGAAAAFVFLAAYALAGDRTEPYARQLWGYARRPRRHRPAPLAPAPQEDAHAPAPAPRPARAR